MNATTLALGRGEPLVQRPERELLLRIEGMHCASCVRAIEQALAPLVHSVRVDLSAGVAEVSWDERLAQAGDLVAAIERAGFKARLAIAASDEASAAADALAESRRGLLRLGVAGLLGMQVMMLAGTRYWITTPIEPALLLLMRYAEWALTTPVLLYSCMPFFRGAWLALRQRSLSMDLPVSLALLLAYAASCANVWLQRGDVYFDSVTMFAFLLLLARWLEGRGRAIAQRRLRELVAVQPSTAMREAADGRFEIVQASALMAGDKVHVAPGESAPADGRLLDASAAFDESLLTGEALPIDKRCGDTLHAGTPNCGLSPARMIVARTGEHTTLSAIQRLMLRSQAQKPKVQQWADRMAGVVVALVLLFAVAGALWWLPRDAATAFDVALAVLVVTCPCALSLATPVALAAASSRLAAQGVLVANADALLRLPQVEMICFDKTGTLTTGLMQCERIEISGIDADEAQRERLLQVVAALERGVRHPVASAFAQIETRLHADKLEVLPGRGLRGEVDGVEYELVALPAEGDLTWISLRDAERERARFALSHRLRPDAHGATAALIAAGMELEILSGDAPGAVRTVARELGIDHHRAEQTPANKLARIQQLQAQGRAVCMVGDGLNDAPVLAAADVSASLAGASTLAQARADLILTKGELAGLPLALEVGRRTRRIVAENLAWAVAYNLVAMPLALAGALTPGIAAAGMGLSSLTVTLNALRLLRSPSAIDSRSSR
ncbi:heavy metal translocating P-type ATPase [Hydrocarboniphaga effusa]|uniref:HMA domain-containing protein n=1 Tax=Hydrocarboniphaga effusa AP103 TaxID=1172194 RepID=I7ZGX2_9GAMM|nr:cation-translocating P-type ATPase [Hydrocarboniphaga effusa]EIT70952.1 hypothetical protein WQQ_10890 [Hydrocarboniphaga effusa AP103]